MSERLTSIDELLKGLKEQATPPSAPVTSEASKKVIAPSDDPKKEALAGEVELEEGCGFSKKDLAIAMASMKANEEFINLYHDGDDKAFETPQPIGNVMEGELDPEIEGAKQRPPKGWFGKCTRITEKNMSVDDPAAVCAWMWHGASPEKKKRMQQAGEE
jgi:hypothetical protein